MTVRCFLKPKATPFAGCGREVVSAVQLDVLHRVAKGKFVHSGTPRCIAVDFDYWKSVHKFLSVGQVGID